MKKEDLFEGFGALDDDLLRRSERGGNFSACLKYGSIAACIAVLLGAGMLWMDQKYADSPVSESNDHVSDDLQEQPESYVDIATLLASNGGDEEQSLEIRLVEIESDSVNYYRVSSAESGILRESLGSEVQGAPEWYRVSGHEDMQYLIFGNGNEYSLWKFESFQKESYPYSDVLQTIYGIHSAEDIAKIMVAPADMDNTDEGQAIQKEIGTSVITDDHSIETIYHVLSGLTCYGGDHWDKIGLGADLLNQVRAGRYLTMVTSLGMEIDTLKYTGISGMFYEYRGIAYSALTAEEKAAVEKILNIEWTGETGSPATEQRETQNEPEAKEYSAELIDLQNRISEAMRNQELPFVISSCIYENPDRVHVTVNTTDEDLIAKLLAFDVTGKLLEIEYSEHAAVLE